jgi:2'-5' RNA ligase
MPETALLVPVLEAAPAIAGWWPVWDPPRAQGIPPHITLLFPFLAHAGLDEDLLRELDSLFTATPAFRFALTGTGRFEGGFLTLVPEPAEPFVRLTETLVRRWPDHPPYGGTVEEVVPHLSVLRSRDEELLGRAERQLATMLPLETRASEIWLMAHADGAWSLLRRFALAQPGVA